MLTLTNITRSYQADGNQLTILQNAHFHLPAGQSVAVVGPSGSGKSTLLHIAGLLDKPQSGQVVINGTNTTHMADAPLSKLRNRTCGFVFQQHHLLRELTALENVNLPAQLGGQSQLPRARELLHAVGLSHRLHHLPSQLSGGEQQRVAVARALINQPRLLLADEPTGNLDPTTAQTVADLMFNLVQQHGSSLLLVTHNLPLAQRCTQRVTLAGGLIVPAKK
jgi:lipoprotein-releasing system ATP-binding protein